MLLLLKDIKSKSFEIRIGKDILQDASKNEPSVAKARLKCRSYIFTSKSYVWISTEVSY